MDSNSKGNILEDAVISVEKMILTEIHKDKIEDIEVTKRKIIEDQGVTYEIDIYAQVNMKKGYTQIFIFECKNWDAVTIPPKEIYYFDRKIEVAGAQRGFFVGTKYTRSAIAMAELLNRVELVEIQKDLPKCSPFVMFTVNHDESEIFDLKFHTSNGKLFDSKELDDKEILYNEHKREINYLERVFIQKLMSKIDSGCRLRNCEVYCENVSDNIDTSDIKFEIDENRITNAYISAKVCLNVTGNNNIRFNVKIGDRGRYTVLTKESMGTCDIGFTISMTQTED